MNPLFNSITNTFNEMGLDEVEILFILLIFTVFIFTFKIFRDHSGLSKQRDDEMRESRLSTLLLAKKNINDASVDSNILYATIYNLIEKSSPYFSFKIFKEIMIKKDETISDEDLKKIQLYVDNEIKRIITMESNILKPKGISHIFFNFISQIFSIILDTIKASFAVIIFIILINSVFLSNYENNIEYLVGVLTAIFLIGSVVTIVEKTIYFIKENIVEKYML